MPLKGTTVAVLDGQGVLQAIRLTDSSGQLKEPIAIAVPRLEDSQTPDYEGEPFSTVTILAQHPAYQQIQVENTQIFAGITTLQPLEMIPIPLYPDSYNGGETFVVPPQNL